jgi:hypothetical protein
MKNPAIDQTTALGAPIPPRPPQPEIEDYTPERIAEFLLNNAVGPAGYAAAREEVRRLGLDPDLIPHQKPLGI